MLRNLSSHYGLLKRTVGSFDEDTSGRQVSGSVSWRVSRMTLTVGDNEELFWG
jgi:hypothetical protein